MAATELLIAKTIVVDSGGIINAVALAGKAEVNSLGIVCQFPQGTVSINAEICHHPGGVRGN